MVLLKRLLAQKGIDVNEEDAKGYTPLQTALLSSQYDAAIALARHPASRFDHRLTKRVLEHALFVPRRSPGLEQFLRLFSERGHASSGELGVLLCWAIRENQPQLAEQLILDPRTRCTKPPEGGVAQFTPFAGASPFSLARRHGRQGLLQMMLERSDVKKELFEDRQVYVDSANTILVGAALIASVAYQGWLQPPLGYSFMVSGGQAYADLEQHSAVRWFWWFNSFAFYFAVATVIAGAAGAMPVRNTQIMESVEKVRRAVSVASVLLAMSIVCVMVAFAAAGIAVLPPHSKGKQVMVVSVGVGASICSVLLLWFSKRLAQLMGLIRLLKDGFIMARRFGREEDGPPTWSSHAPKDVLLKPPHATTPFHYEVRKVKSLPRIFSFVDHAGRSWNEKVMKRTSKEDP